MKTLQASFIFFFYFIKYPLVLGLPIAYVYADFTNNWILNILWIISLLLILKDWFFPHKPTY